MHPYGRIRAALDQAHPESITSATKRRNEELEEEIRERWRREDQEEQERLAYKEYARWSRTKGKWVDELVTESDVEGDSLRRFARPYQPIQERCPGELT